MLLVYNDNLVNRETFRTILMKILNNNCFFIFKVSSTSVKLKTNLVVLVFLSGQNVLGVKIS